MINEFIENNRDISMSGNDYELEKKKRGYAWAKKSFEKGFLTIENLAYCVDSARAWGDNELFFNGVSAFIFSKLN